MSSLVRNKRLLLNIKWSALMRVSSIGVNFLLVPLLLDHLGESNYGIWLTISSFLGWSTLLDLGVGHGLKNRLSEAVAHDRIKEYKVYTSSAYIIMSAVAFVALILFAIAATFLDWRGILNAHDVASETLKVILLLFFFFFCIKLVLNQVLNVAAATQSTFLADIVNFVINSIYLILVLLIPFMPIQGLLAVTVIFGLVPIATLIGISLWAFRGAYSDFKPDLRMADWNVAKDILGLGGRFFVIQIAGIIMFNTDNLIISHFIEPAAVSSYHIAFRYFGIVITFFSILCTPIWPAFTEAYVKKEFDWIRLTTKRLVKIWMLMVLLVLVMLYFSPMVYEMWVGEEIKMPWELSIIMAAYVITLTWGTIYVTFINSIGALRIQLISSVIAGLVNVPLSIWIIENTTLGAAGVMLATIICLSYGPILSMVQYKKIMNRTAKGIWLK